MDTSTTPFELFKKIAQFVYAIGLLETDDVSIVVVPVSPIDVRYKPIVFPNFIRLNLEKRFIALLDIIHSNKDIYIAVMGQEQLAYFKKLCPNRKFCDVSDLIPDNIDSVCNVPQHAHYHIERIKHYLDAGISSPRIDKFLFAIVKEKKIKTIIMSDFNDGYTHIFPIFQKDEFVRTVQKHPKCIFGVMGEDQKMFFSSLELGYDHTFIDTSRFNSNIKVCRHVKDVQYLAKRCGMYQNILSAADQDTTTPLNDTMRFLKEDCLLKEMPKNIVFKLVDGLSMESQSNYFWWTKK